MYRQGCEASTTVNTWTVTRTPAGMGTERVNRKCLLGLRGHPSAPALCGLPKVSGAGYQLCLGFCGQAGVVSECPPPLRRQEGWRRPRQEACFHFHPLWDGVGTQAVLEL